MSGRSATRVAWGLCALILALLSCSVAFSAVNRTLSLESIYLVGVVSSALVGGLISSRRPANPIGWLFLGSAASFALQELTIQYAVYGLRTEPGALPLARAMAWPSTWLWVPGVMLVYVFVPLFFPDGRLVSRRWRWVARFDAGYLMVLAVLFAFLLKVADDRTGVANPLVIEAPEPVVRLLLGVSTVLFLPVGVASAASLVVRFRRALGEERQQIKWVVYAAAALPVMFSIDLLIQAVAPALSPVTSRTMDVLFAGIPVAVGIAVLRYRLYDIDRIINRTLVYSVLTMLLVAVYVGSVVALQYAFRALIGQETQLVVVASTLAIAALFGPLRRRTQGFIDHRFYRRKYDAARTLADFNLRLRNETNLDALSEDLVAVTRDTMQPAHVSLWMKPARVAGSGDRTEERRR